MDHDPEMPQLDPSKPVTDDLRRRGFSYDIMGLLLAHCQRDVADKCALYARDERITTAQAQKLIDFILTKYDFSFCDSCDAIECWQDRNITNIRIVYCCWCAKGYCTNCQVFDKVCRDCNTAEWCPACGKDVCVKSHTCESCKHAVCDNVSGYSGEPDYIECSRCYLTDARMDLTWPYGKTPNNYETLCMDAIRSVMARLGIKENHTP